jgi:methionyl-tRNA formyltransferase
MRIVLLTQNEPFFLKENIQNLLEGLPAHSRVVGCVLFSASPFGKRAGALRKAWDTQRIFGIAFFAHYLARFLVERLRGRGSVLRMLHQKGIPVLRPQGSINDPTCLKAIRSIAPDLLISIAGNQIFKRPLLDLAPNGCLNLHSSLLPRYRGLMPSFWVLRHGEQETGASVFFVDEGIDSGPIIVQKRLGIQGLSQQEVIRLTKALGMQCVIEAVDLIHRGGYQLIPNEGAESTYFRFPTREDVKAFRAAGARFF